MRTDTTQITGLTLIDKALEFESMTPVKSEWSLDIQKDNPSRFIRLQQLNVLLKLFTPDSFDTTDIALGLDNLFRGQFILHRDNSKYYNLYALMDKEIISSKHNPPKAYGWTLDHLIYNFTDVVNFKRNVNEVKSHNNGILEISYPYYYSVILTDKISNKIDTKNIDKFLSLVIDPLGRRFSKDDLIRDYNYPTEDVYDIDLDLW